MKNQQLIFVLLVTFCGPSLSFLFGKKEKNTTPLYEIGSRHPCPIGDTLKDDNKKIHKCTPGLYNSCPLSHECRQGVCCLLPADQQFNPCKNGLPLKHPETKANVACKFTSPNEFSCPSGYECNTQLMDAPSVCCPVKPPALTTGSSNTPEINDLVANISSLWNKVNELERCCNCGKYMPKHHDSHQHEHNHDHEADQHVGEKHGEKGSHYHDHKHGPHHFEYQKSVEVHAHCEMKPNGALSLQKMVPIRGFVHLKQMGTTALEMHINLSGWPVSISGKRTVALHVHEYGDLRNNCESLGEHYNPSSVSHGGPDDIVRHPGDFGNIAVNAEGKINVVKSDNMAVLFGKYSIIGRSIVIHESFDDLGRGVSPTSQTTGNAGSRIGCCVIGYAAKEH